MAGYSVIIPTLNETGWLPKLLESLAAQTLSPSEIIVVDGGSTDTTCALVHKFQQKWHHKKAIQPKLRLIHSATGISHQRNVGAEHAKENILIFLDADVVLNTKDIALLLRHFFRTRADIVVPMYTVGPTAYWAVQILYIFLSAMVWFAQWTSLTGGSGQCIVVHASTFKMLKGFNTQFRIVEDLDFLRRASSLNLKTRVARLRITVSDRRFTPSKRWQTIWLYLKVSWWSLFNQHHHQTKAVEYVLGEHLPDYDSAELR